MASATDISTGSRVPFTQGVFDLLCSDLKAVRLSRAAASVAVPVAPSTLTVEGRSGSCNIGLRGGEALADGANRPFIQRVDGGISDNVGMRGVLDALQLVEALHVVGQPTPLGRVKRIVILVVNSLSSPPTTWHRLEPGPGMVNVRLKSSGVPIDRYCGESIEQL